MDRGSRRYDRLHIRRIGNICESAAAGECACQTQCRHERIRIRQIVAVGLDGQRSATRDLTLHLRPHGSGHRR